MFSWNVGGSIKVEIQCDGKPIEIVDLRGIRYAVIPNDASFFEQEVEEEVLGDRFKQSYRYTPFTVIATQTATKSVPIDVELFLDGTKAGGFVVTPEFPVANFRGFNTQGGTTQYCFSPPRVGLAQTGASEPNLELGAIRFDMHETTFLRTDENFHMAVHETFKDSTKKDAANAGKDMSIGFMTIKQGNLVEKRSAVGRRTNVYNVPTGDPFCTERIRYVTEYAMTVLRGKRGPEVVPAEREPYVVSDFMRQLLEEDAGMIGPSKQPKRERGFSGGFQDV